MKSLQVKARGLMRILVDRRVNVIALLGLATGLGGCALGGSISTPLPDQGVSRIATLDHVSPNYLQLSDGSTCGDWTASKNLAAAVFSMGNYVGHKEPNLNVLAEPEQFNLLTNRGARISEEMQNACGQTTLGQGNPDETLGQLYHASVAQYNRTIGGS